MLPFNKDLKHFARELRKNMTDAERTLWSKIRRKQMNGHIFYRQRNIGNYIVDFYCPAAKLVIGLDGGQHYTEEGKAKDAIRDGYLSGLGLKILRVSDGDVFKNLAGVLQAIYENTRIPPAPL